MARTVRTPSQPGINPREEREVMLVAQDEPRQLEISRCGISEAPLYVPNPEQYDCDGIVCVLSDRTSYVPNPEQYDFRDVDANNWCDDPTEIIEPQPAFVSDDSDDCDDATSVNFCECCNGICQATRPTRQPEVSA